MGRCGDEPVCGDGPLWRWTEVALGWCGDGPVWTRAVCRYLAMDRCGDGPVWRWAGLALDRFGVGPVWRWTGVAMDRCGDGLVWTRAVCRYLGWCVNGISNY